MKRYIVSAINEPVPLCGRVEAAPWASAETARIDCYPWYAGGQKQSTAVAMLCDAGAIYFQFRCRDRHIFSQVTELNGPVCTDSCVELFAAIDPQSGPDYFNLEINCCGVMHLGFGPDRKNRRLIEPGIAAKIEIAHSVAGPTKQESPDDEAWWIAAKVPLDVLGELAGRTVRPQRGTAWRGNFYRCGGKTDVQFACWNPIDTPKPDFHRPEYFGEITFG